MAIRSTCAGFVASAIMRRHDRMGRQELFPDIVLKSSRRLARGNHILVRCTSPAAAAALPSAAFDPDIDRASTFFFGMDDITRCRGVRRLRRKRFPMC